MASYPVWANSFKIELETVMTVIKGLENFSPAIDGTIETWFQMDQNGWQSAQSTGKALTFSFSGKRIYGDAGNDAVAEMAWKIGADCEKNCEWTLPNGDVVTFSGVFNVTSSGGGDTTAIDALEFEVTVNGAPTYTPHVG